MSYSFYVGTYTFQGAKGIYRMELSDGGALREVGSAEAENPSYLIYSPDRKYLYAANEAKSVDGVPGGAVTAFEVEGGGGLKKIVTRTTGGGAPCHLCVHEGYLYAANYGAGTVTVYPLEDGLPQAAAFTHRHEGHGPNERRQEGPHAHCAAEVPGTGGFCVVDLGIDQVRFYRRAGAGFELTQALSFPGGSGPRHIVVSDCGNFAWVVSELSNEVFSLRREKTVWTITGAHSTLPEGTSLVTSCAAIRRSHDGKLIVASNRGHDSVACYSADETTGLLTPIGIFPTGGSQPRDVAFSPDDKWLVAANQESDRVTVLAAKEGFRIVDEAGAKLSKPVCILF
jgi:6-phosphogluconolactonase